MRLLARFPHLTLFLHDGPCRALEAQWHGAVGGAVLRRALLECATWAQAEGICGYIADDRLLGPLRPEDAAWSAAYVLPLLVRHGLRRLARLDAPDPLTQRAVARTQAAAAQQWPFEVRAFADLDAARAWACALPAGAPPPPVAPPAAAPLPALPYYAAAYDAGAPVVRGRGLRALTAEELTHACELLLALSRRHACARWLLDRRDDRPGPQLLELYDWLQAAFFPRVREALGDALRVALLVTPAEHARLQQYHHAPALAWLSPAVRVSWWTDEAAARRWLAAGPAAPEESP